ncbi:class I SAM-dependent methyltransferase [Algoriphagus sp. PAP.12]|uniref:class I SAM-dependent methyltransferase n=1 Tax=Algoriphagus sp. PAP.12 TaxID=2996678 RepID=UPI00227CF40E|nr:class I SAM-dependent methyltransferase [Algoriphagus sp. PAP.12]
MPIDFSPCRCHYCGSTALGEFSAQERMFGKGDTFSYQECEECASIQINPIPVNLGDYYTGDEYYSFIPLVKSGSFSNLLKAIRLRGFLNLKIDGLAPKVYGYWLKKVFTNFDVSVADVGCGNGQLLYELNAGGFKDLIGFDPFLDKSIEVAEGLCLLKSELSESDQKFDLIMYHHAFEHLRDPEKELQVCFDKLNSKGKALIRIPVTDSEVWQKEREYWVQLDAPRHLTIPSVKGISGLSEKIGFKVDAVEFDSTEFQFWGTELYKRGQKLRSNGWDEFSQTEMEKWKKKALHFNREGKGDQICLYLSKPE